jgi:pimeloyl-ACP methyl ester carboxylesterase
MAEAELGTNPDALPGAEPPRTDRYPVNGTTLYAEVRGSGPTVLLIHAGAEDAEEWRAVAERLDDFTVVTYDRRGTRRSGRDDWPGGGAAQHADDAAGLLGALGLDDAVVFGASSGGNIALQLALRHPGLLRRTLAWEPGHLRQVAGGDEVYRKIRDAGNAHLTAHPDDWAGAYAAVLRSLGLAPDQPPGGIAEPSPDRTWHDEREDGNAESLMLDDIPILTGEIIDEAALASAPGDIRFGMGAQAQPIFREVTLHLAAVRRTRPDVVVGLGHGILYRPDEAAAYLRRAIAA